VTYIEIFELKNPGSSAVDLLKKTTVAVVKTAQFVLAEDANTANHEARARWARTALVNAEQMAQAMFWAVLSNGDVQAAGQGAADSLVQFCVDVSVNLFAA
jgi:hypothetical protein